MAGAETRNQREVQQQPRQNRFFAAARNRVAMTMAAGALFLGAPACDADGNPTPVDPTDSTVDTNTGQQDSTTNPDITVPDNTDTLEPSTDTGEDPKGPDVEPPPPLTTPALNNSGVILVPSGTGNTTVSGTVSSSTFKIFAREDGEASEIPVTTYISGSEQFTFPIPVGEKCQFVAEDENGERTGWSDFVEVLPELDAPNVQSEPVEVGLNDTSIVLDAITVPEYADTLVVYQNGQVFDSFPVTAGEFVPTLDIDGVDDPTGTFTFAFQNKHGDEFEGSDLDVSWAAPTISNLAIDTSETWDMVLTGGEVYTMTFDAENMVSATANVELVSGGGEPGTVSEVTVEGGQGTLEYTSGTESLDIVHITVAGEGKGGDTVTSEAMALTLQ